MNDRDREITPESVDLKDSTHTFVVTWKDGKKTQVPYRELRILCRCAGCIDELTGQPILDPNSVPADIGIVHAEEVGHYAIRFDWSDGHGTGIYPWDRIRAVGAS